MHGSYSPTGETRSGVVNGLETQRATAATYRLESRGQASSTGLKHSEPRQHSHTGEPRTGIVSRSEKQRSTVATHSLESRGHASLAGLKHSEPRQPPTH